MAIHPQTGSLREPIEPTNPSQAEFDRLISRYNASGKTPVADRRVLHAVSVQRSLRAH